MDDGSSIAGVCIFFINPALKTMFNIIRHHVIVRCRVLSLHLSGSCGHLQILNILLLPSLTPLGKKRRSGQAREALYRFDQTRVIMGGNWDFVTEGEGTSLLCGRTAA